MRTLLAAVVMVIMCMGLALVADSGEAQSPNAPNRRSKFDFSDSEIQHLKQQYLSLAEKRVARMDGPDLQKAVAEMRRSYLIAELANLANESEGDRLAEMRAGIAATVLSVGSTKELETLLRTMAKELEAMKLTTP
jgi:hypothetical protein